MCTPPTENPIPKTSRSTSTSRLLRTVFGVDGLPPRSRAPIRSGLGHARSKTVNCSTTCSACSTLMFRSHPSVPMPGAGGANLINASTFERRRPAVYVVEDVHWIDSVSEAMLADFAAVGAEDPVHHC